MNGTRIFLIDGLGALFSTICLILLYIYEQYIGMPRDIIQWFILLAIFFTVYSLTCHFTKPQHWKRYLTILAVLNLCYTTFTLYEVIQNAAKLTTLGYLYFIGEIIVLIVLVFFEWRIATTG